ncbi:sodium/proton antiporter NhaB [Fulvivirgaceae bacterium BMA10]|uniref:Sodium/proton antiporter NhaB n=1 Tax=Splendidivirga corallicola TaxID=3051826 RepID=A0ABT8KMW1_9BACT|nr:sodium/proton antiporter NhaB [Fulvivirgaceae bacterium BMA10]
MKGYRIFFKHFLGNSPAWYKQLIILFLLLNPLLYYIAGPTITGWMVLFEFILTLVMALKCYPLLPGGLITIEIVFMGMVGPEEVYHEIQNNLQVIMLLLFMVAGIHFMKDLLTYIFTKILVGIKSKMLLSLTFCFLGAILSAWLDALTVTAVMITVVTTFYRIYNATSIEERVPGDKSDGEKHAIAREDLQNFDGFLRNLLMHGLVGTALGGVSTMVGEPQNLLIASTMNWTFGEFYINMAHITIPVVFFGFFTCIYIELHKVGDYGYKLPKQVRVILENSAKETEQHMTGTKKWYLLSQAACAVWLIVALALHLAEVGLIGLSIIVLLATVMGKTNEHTIGNAFQEGTPFVSLLITFFVVVAMIEHNHLFEPVLEHAMTFDGISQTYFFFMASALLSIISDNVFVATIYMKQAAELLAGDPEQLRNVAVAINVGTNIPSIATPNGQAAFLFLLTNNIAGRIQLSYFKMIKMAFPYLVVLLMVTLIFLGIDWF